MKVFCTGISGSNHDKYLGNLINYARELGTDINLYSVGDYFKKNAGKYFGNYNENKILDIPFYARAPVVGESFEEIMNDTSSKKSGNVIVSCHGSFYWDKLIERAFLPEKITKMNPDMFVTFIKDTESIKQELNCREQWKEQNLTIDEVSLWQDTEVNNTEAIANIMGKPSYIIASNEPPGLLYKLMFHPEFKRTYASFPMTNLEENAEKIDNFISILIDYRAVFNPRAIEIGKKAEKAVEMQTVKRDLEWWIGKADETCVFFPIKVFSGGSVSEIKESHDRGKDVIGVMPDEKLGPFEKKYIDRIFYSLEELKNYFEQEFKEKGLKRWSEMEKELMKKE